MKPSGNIPSGDSKYAPPDKARKEMDDPVKAGGSMAHEGVMESGRVPSAKGCMGWGERSAKAQGVMGKDQ